MNSAFYSQNDLFFYQSEENFHKDFILLCLIFNLNNDKSVIPAPHRSSKSMQINHDIHVLWAYTPF